MHTRMFVYTHHVHMQTHTFPRMLVHVVTDIDNVFNQRWRESFSQRMFERVRHCVETGFNQYSYRLGISLLYLPGWCYFSYKRVNSIRLLCLTMSQNILHKAVVTLVWPKRNRNKEMIDSVSDEHIIVFQGCNRIQPTRHHLTQGQLEVFCPFFPSQT